ncbi:MAG: DUF2461 domain-containing protein [Desulfomonilaceae bacterium]
MAGISVFGGFPKECVDYYTELAQNNSKTWFDGHKNDFEKYVMGPARDFVSEMGRFLAKISPKINADPRVNRSIFRPYRDIRFSKDKTPYKTHLGIFFWEGSRAKMECSGYYFHLEPPTVFLAAGIHCFSPSLLGAYRDSVVDPKHGPELIKAIRQISKLKGYSIGGTHYKKTPRGYNANDENAAMLLHNGLYAWIEDGIPAEFYSAQILDYCIDRFKKMSSLHRWLVDMTARAGT